MALEISILKELTKSAPKMQLSLDAGERDVVYLVAHDEAGQKWTLARISPDGIRLYSNVGNSAYPLDVSGKMKIIS